MEMPEHITTERLILRTPRQDDARAIFEGWAQDQEVTRYLTWRPHQRIEETQALVQNCLAAWEQARRFPYMITRQGILLNISFTQTSAICRAIAIYMQLQSE